MIKQPEPARDSVAIDGPEIRRRRKERGWTVTYLAIFCGISQQYLSFIERGDRKMVSRQVFERLCAALQVPVKSRRELMLAEGDTAA